MKELSLSTFSVVPHQGHSGEKSVVHHQYVFPPYINGKLQGAPGSEPEAVKIKLGMTASTKNVINNKGKLFSNTRTK